MLHFFENNGSQFSEEELNTLENILNKGVQEKQLEDSVVYNENWRLSWYSALKETSRFKNLYEVYSTKLNTTSDYFKDRHKVRVRVGHVTPFIPEEILQKSVTEIVANIESFVPGDKWEGPSVEGYADSLGKAVEENPEKFATGALLFVGAPLPYINAILYGLNTAWRNKKGFEWKPPMELSYHLLQKKDQIDETTGSETFYRINQNILAGTIGWFLSEGLRDDAHAFDKSILPLSRTILLAAADHIQPDTRPQQSGMDYVTHSLNTVSGKLLRAFLDYALRKARIDDSTIEKNGMIRSSQFLRSR